VVEIEFFGGVGVIGGSKVSVSTEHSRVMFDCGSDLPLAADLFAPPVLPRPGRELADLVAVGQTRWIPGLFDPAHSDPRAESRDPRAESRGPRAAPVDDRELGVFVSHAHVDHDGLLGFLRQGLVVHASPETVRLEQALAASGKAPTGRPVDWQSVPYGDVVTVGDITVEFIPVDHDVPGASALLVTTPQGRIAYTGDLNLHRDGGLRTRAFAERVAGVDVLLSETTGLSFDEERPLAGEDEILGRFLEVCGRPGLQLVSLYERDIDRAQRWITAAADLGRRIVWPSAMATTLAGYGVSDVVTWVDHRQASAHLDLATITLDEVRAAPASYVVQLASTDPAQLLDLPVTASTVWVHSQGEPLGPFMSDWAPFQAWLDHAGIETVQAGSSGHATGADLQQLVNDIAPGVVFPFHGFKPERLVGPRRTVLPAYGVRYRLDGAEIGPA